MSELLLLFVAAACRRAADSRFGGVGQGRSGRRRRILASKIERAALGRRPISGKIPA